MNRPDWNSLSDDFASKVLQITDCDTHKVILKAARRIARGRSSAIDFGCGTGASTRLIAPLFETVTGVDYAADLLQEAEELTAADNVSYVRANLSSQMRLSFQADVAFCINCLIHPDHGARLQIARQIASCLTPGGAALFVVPSLESVLRTYQTLIRCGAASGEKRSTAARTVRHQASEEMESPAEGIVRVGGMATKHYLHDELAEFLSEAGFNVTDIQRVAFPWDVELDAAPNWLGPPTPWDWMAMAGPAA